MIKPVPISYKIVGSTLILFGLVALLFLYLADESILISEDSENILVKYFIVITMTNCAFAMIVTGILFIIGLLMPYYLVGDDKYEEAKHWVIGFILLLPLLITSSVTILTLSESTPWKFAWFTMVIVLGLLFLSSVRIINQHLTNNSSGTR